MAETRVEIALPSLGPADGSSTNADQHGKLVGILRRQNDAASSKGRRRRPIALILHGVLAHKDQLFHRQLAAQLPMDSFRFDFRHAVEGGESREAVNGPAWDMANFSDDVIDMHVVVRYLRQTFGYHVEVIVSHSRGTLDTWSYYWDVEQRRRGTISNRRDDFILDRVPLFVAIAGRWDMTRMRARGPHAGHDFKTQDWFAWKARVAGKSVSVRIVPDMIERFATYPIQEMVCSFPASCDVLVIHGDKDPTVPVQDAYAFKKHLDTAQPGQYARQGRPASTQLRIVPGADHTFRGHFDAVTDAVCSWVAERRRLAETASAESSSEEKAFWHKLEENSDARRDGATLGTWSADESLDGGRAGTSPSKL